MMRLEEALAIVQSAAWRLPVETVPLAEAAGRYLAEPVISDVEMPPFDRSMLDGFACRAADLPGPMPQADYVLAGECAAGPLPAGACARVMTGAPVPEGADYVFGIEQAEETPAGVRFTGTKGKGNNFARRAEDVRVGDVLLTAGARLAAQHLAICAAAGCASLQVSRRPRVGVMATGSELVPVDATPQGAQIRNSNSIQLCALAREPGADVNDLGIVHDELAMQRDALARALEENDVVLSTGGASVGDRDYLPRIIGELGFDIRVRQVGIQPGKPIVFGVRGDQACFALAGNPLSSYVQFLLLVRPFLSRLQGGAWHPCAMRVPLAVDYSRGNAARTMYHPAMLGADGGVTPVVYHGSGHLTAYAEADGLVVIPEGMLTAEAGTFLEFIPLD